jgi:transcriptional regulator with XRE-family HTH domain
MERQKFYEELGGKIKTLRERFITGKKMSQEQLGRSPYVVLSKTTIANIEAGRQQVSVHQLFGIAKALDVLVTDLLTGLEVEVEENGLSKEVKKFVKQL